MITFLNADLHLLSLFRGFDEDLLDPGFHTEGNVAGNAGGICPSMFQSSHLGGGNSEGAISQRVPYHTTTIKIQNVVNL